MANIITCPCVSYRVLIFKVDNNTYCMCLWIKIDEFFSLRNKGWPHKTNIQKFEYSGIYILVYTFVYTCCIAKLRDMLRSMWKAKQVAKKQNQVEFVHAKSLWIKMDSYCLVMYNKNIGIKLRRLYFIFRIKKSRCTLVF